MDKIGADEASGKRTERGRSMVECQSSCDCNQRSSFLVRRGKRAGLNLTDSVGYLLRADSRF